MDDLSGQTINGYKFLERVARAGMGDVYRAEQLSVHREVAIKVIKPELASNLEFIERFEREAQMIAQLRHPNIVTLIDYWLHESRAFLVMLWLPGGSLRARLRPGGLEIDYALLLIDQIASALAYAHRKGFIHRDVKPDNILLDDNRHAYLTDFGIAKDLTSQRNITPAGDTVPGTPAYAAPEQLMGNPVTTQTDIYSLGIMIFELLTGEHPFPGSTAFQYIVPALPPVQTRRPDLPGALNPIIERALKRDSSARYQSALDLAAAVRQAFGGHRVREDVPTPIPGPSTGTPDLPTTPVVTGFADNFVFISHSTTDDVIVRRVYEALAAAGINAWVDHINGIGPGDRWPQQIQKALNACERGLLVLSPNSALSDVCRSEWNTLLTLKKQLNVVLLAPVSPEDMPFELNTIHYVDLSQDFEVGMARLVEDILNERSIPPKQPTPAHSSGALSAILIKTVQDVPQRPRKLIGRDMLLAKAQALLNQGEPVLLQGFGGMGKTALAAEVVAAQTVAGSVPALWLDVGHASVSGMLEALARPFDAQQIVASGTSASRIQAVRSLLVEQGIKLMVLDNVWSDGAILKQVMEAIPRELPLLVTSRRRYPIGEIVRVGELELDSALSLLSYYARQTYTTDDTGAVTLCQQLGYHAYALEIAGKTLQVDELTPEQLLQRMADAPHSLEMPEGFAEEGRESVKELLDASVNALDEAARAVFLAFGALFVPDCTEALMAAYMKRLGKPIDAADVLNELQRRGLAERIASGHYHVHDLSYSYVKKSFVGQNRQKFIAACLDYLREHKDNLDALDAERLNIMRAAEAAHNASQDDVLVNFMRLLLIEGPYFDSRGHTPLSLELLKAAKDAARAKGQLETAYRFLGELGYTYTHYIANLDTAFTLYQEALELARMMQNSNLEAKTLSSIGNLRFRQGADDADDYYDRAAQIARDHDDDAALAVILQHRGYKELKAEKDFERGRRFSDEAAQIALRLSLHNIYFHALQIRGGCEYELGQPEQALITHQEGYKLSQDHANYIWMAEMLWSMGEDYDALGHRDEAQKAFDESLVLWHQTGGAARAAELIEIMKKGNYQIKAEY
jgi:serine/threonine protein kinase/tetratricopeptide (TPR) repeat protein